MSKKLTYFLFGISGILLLIIIFKKRGKIISFVLSKEQEYYLSELHPKYEDKFRNLVTEIQKKGYRVIITSGYRSFQKQAELKKQNPKNASPGLSTHNYGIAIDLSLQIGATIITKSNSIEKWLSTGVPQMAKKMGFFWGGDFKGYHDPVHFEIDLDTSKLLARAKQQFGDISKIKGNEVLIT
ncbi:MAG: hypothetical protein UT61_C0025G0010 [Candidatus Woesebacteria bacterium GW2011_GWA1_39_8]|uniref:Peptidase M15C domain-containing protein n=1 Tax=Candidatus Woesebacteria bacterium GW2011_GWA1_39_8 TaxID=1618552 RepID=A0A0G0PP55_9BACT|nr:MAG: hypothetical protein UT61_C0025G0010 [Candidatus Woesebacteria bacterium GW2011_GWA1_39_8]